MSAGARFSPLGTLRPIIDPINRRLASPARRIQTTPGPGLVLRPSRRAGLTARLLTARLVAALITVAMLHNAVAQPTARESPGVTPESTRPAGEAAAGKASPKPWQWQLGVGIPLLAIGVIMTGVGGAFLVNPPVTDPTGCNVLGFAGPCQLGRASSGAVLGLGLAFGVGGVVLTGFGIHSLVQAGGRSTAGETQIKDVVPVPTTIPAASAE